MRLTQPRKFQRTWRELLSDQWLYRMVAATLFAVLMVFLLPPLDHTSVATGDQVMRMVAATALWFFIGLLLTTMVHFVGPKQAHALTFFGTRPLKKPLETGIRITLPWPIVNTYNIVATNVRVLKMPDMLVTSSDNVVYKLPCDVHWQVSNPVAYTFERYNPDAQTENFLNAALRRAANSMTFMAVYADHDSVKNKALEHVEPILSQYGVVIKEILVQDPIPSEETARAMSSVRESQFTAEAAGYLAMAAYEGYLGDARGQALTLLLKANAKATHDAIVAEGLRTGFDVLMGHVGVTFEHETVRIGKEEIDVLRPHYTDVAMAHANLSIPRGVVDARDALMLLLGADGNDAVRYASGGKGSTVVVPTNAGQNVGIPAALLGSRNEGVDTAKTPT